jgi:hypothetical protein
MTEREVMEQIEEINRLMEEMDSRVYIGDPEPNIEVTDEHIKELERFMIENDLYDR